MGTTWKLAKGTLYSRGLKLGRLDGFERLIAGIFGTPDRVPVIVQPYTYAMAMHGLSAERFFREPEPFINASFNMAAYFGFDFWSPTFDFYNIELEALGARLLWRDASEPDIDARTPLVTGEDDLRRLRPPAPGRSGRMPYVLESYGRYMDVMGIPPMCYCCSPFTMAVLARGYVEFLRDMRRNPRFAHRLLEFLSMEVVAPWIEKMAGVTQTSMVVMSDAWASAPNMKIETVKEFCLPYVQRVMRETSSSMLTVLDSGSWGEKEVADPREIFDIKMEMMVPGNRFKPLRPFYLLVWNEDYEAVGVDAARAYADEKSVCLMLNLRPDLIEEGPAGAVVETVREVIRGGAGSGRFVLLFNLVPLGAPVEHVHAAVAAAKRFGRYPVRGLDDIRIEPTAFEGFDEWRRRDGLSV